MVRLLFSLITAACALTASTVCTAQLQQIEAAQQHDLISAAEFALNVDVNATIADALNLSYESRIGKDAINLGYQQNPVWMRIEFNYPQLQSAQKSVLKLGSTQLSEVSLFHYLNGELIDQLTINQNTSFRERSVPHRELAFVLTLQTGRHTLYIRMTSNLGMVIAPALISEAIFYQGVATNDQIMAALYGALLVLLLYNFLVFLSTRDVLFLSHVAVMLTMLLWNLASTGVGFQYLWPDNPEFTPVIQRVSIALFSACLGLFSYAMFKEVFWPPLVHRLNVVGIVANLIIVAFPVFQWYPGLAFIGLSICPAVCVYLSIEVVRQKLRTGYYYATAWSIMAMAFGVGIARVFGWVPVNVLTDNISLLAVLASVGVLSLDLAGRIKTERIARGAAEASTKNKMEFLANMSHEIRTPMNAILGFVDLALTTKMDKEQHLYLDKIQGSSKSLMNIINDILDYSKIESGKLEMERQAFSIDELCQQVLDMFEHGATEKSLQLVYKRGENVPDSVVGDSMRLGQVLINLIGNAVKFTHAGNVTLCVMSQAMEDDADEQNPSNCKIKFAVLDTGIGISPEQKSHLFQPFSQADNSTTRKYGGTGLGLSISKQIVGLMGSEIQLESEQGHGSEFSFCVLLPIAEAEESVGDIIVETNTIGDTEAMRPWEGAHVLLVEDNQVNQLLALTILRKGNVRVQVANNGREAIRAIKQNTFDLVLMDIQMPVMDGYEATRSIRKELSMEDLPVIAMTANAMDSDRDRCLKAGMNDFLSKPINRENMYHTIGQWVRQ